MRTNLHMRELLGEIRQSCNSSELPGDAEAILQAGWTVGPGGALLLRALWDGRRSEIALAEVGRYEYEINDVYISLIDLADDMSGYLGRAAERGMALAATLLVGASGLPAADSLVAVVVVFVDTENEDFLIQGSRVRFFTRRGDYPDWFEDLEKFKHEAIALVEMSDAIRP